MKYIFGSFFVYVAAIFAVLLLAIIFISIPLQMVDFSTQFLMGFYSVSGGISLSSFHFGVLFYLAIAIGVFGFFFILCFEGGVRASFAVLIGVSIIPVAAYFIIPAVGLYLIIAIFSGLFWALKYVMFWPFFLVKSLVLSIGFVNVKQ